MPRQKLQKPNDKRLLESQAEVARLAVLGAEKILRERKK